MNRAHHDEVMENAYKTYLEDAVKFWDEAAIKAQANSLQARISLGALGRETSLPPQL